MLIFYARMGHILHVYDTLEVKVFVKVSSLGVIDQKGITSKFLFT